MLCIKSSSSKLSYLNLKAYFIMSLYLPKVAIFASHRRNRKKNTSESLIDILKPTIARQNLVSYYMTEVPINLMNKIW